jgi:hypothetical protein
LTIAFTACSKKETNQTSNSDNNSETNQVNTNDDLSKNNSVNANDELSEVQVEDIEALLEDPDSYLAIDTFEIKIDGKKFTLPFKWTEIEDIVHSYLYDPPTEVQYEEQIDFYFLSNNGKGANIMVDVFNPYYSSPPVSLDKAWVCEVYMRTIYDEDNYVDIILPKGITFGASPEEVLNAYGKPYNATAWVIK